MPSSFTLSGRFRDAIRDLEEGMKQAAEEAMEAVVAQAEKDAKERASWNERGRHTKQYGETTWDWEVTDMARKSITGYVVPKRNFPQLPPVLTLSYKNGRPLRHVSSTSPAIPPHHSPQPDKVIGVLTMFVASSSYLQEWEQKTGDPIVLEVFEANWETFYIPSKAAPIIEKRMRAIARKYT